MVLVTGGTGLVGSHILLDLIRSGKRVRAIHRKNTDFSYIKKVFSYEYPEEEAAGLYEKIEWAEADILDVPALTTAFLGISHVYHCAALISFDPVDYINLRRTNIEGTANIVNMCSKNRVAKLCYVSSMATFDKEFEKNPITETSHWNQEKNHNAYAITKYGAEIEVWRASQEGVPVIIVNPGIIIGPGFWHSGSGRLFGKIHKGLKFYFPKKTGFVGVEDVVKAMRQLMDSSIKNEKFIVVSQNLSFKTVLEKIAVSLNKPIPKKKIRPWMLYLGWAYQKISCFVTGKERTLTHYAIKSLFKTSIYSNEKIRKQLDFKFKEMDMVISRTGKLFLKDPLD